MKGGIESIERKAAGNGGANAEVEGFNFTTTKETLALTFISTYVRKHTIANEKIYIRNVYLRLLNVFRQILW